MIRTVLFDLDGVIRHFSADDTAAIEERHSLDKGVLQAAAFSQPLLGQVTTGHISRVQWVEQIGELIGCQMAADEWSRVVPSVDSDILILADELRQLGLTIAILTNGTDTIAAEVAESGISQHFDRVFNSADIGYAKPDRRTFDYVQHVLDCPYDQIFFTDDSPSKVAGAHALGMSTHVFTGISSLRVALSSSGIALSQVS